MAGGCVLADWLSEFTFLLLLLLSLLLDVRVLLLPAPPLLLPSRSGGSDTGAAASRRRSAASPSARLIRAPRPVLSRSVLPSSVPPPAARSMVEMLSMVL